MGHANQEDQSAQHFRISQLSIPHVLLLGFAVFLHHLLQFGPYRLLGRTGNGGFVMQS